MMRAFFARSSVRVGLSFAAGALVASVVLGPGVSAAGHAITKAALQPRAASCSAYDFHPVDSDTWYDYSGMLLYHHVTDAHPGGSGFFICDPKLPQSAVVTKVQFTVYDNFNGDQVRFCALARTPLAGGVPESYDELASVRATGVLATPGRIRLSSASVQFPTIDNTKFGYWAQCQVTAEPNTDDLTGIYGFQVYYSIDPAKG